MRQNIMPGYLHFNNNRRIILSLNRFIAVLTAIGLEWNTARNHRFQELST